MTTLMSKEELLAHPDCPDWIKKANIEWCTVSLVDGTVIWHSGVWIDGTWNNGEWLSGVWHNGNWLNGFWHNGFWHDGDWHNGDWHNGFWHSGVWHNGTWNNGEWIDGTWHDGYRACASKWSITSNGNIIKIGCKEKTIAEWDEWFAGTEEYETQRGTLLFKMIYAHYCAVKTYKQVLTEGE